MLVVEHTADNSLVTFRFKNAVVKMLAAEEDFELRRAEGSGPAPSSLRSRTAIDRVLEPSLTRSRAVGLGASTRCLQVKTHDLDVPRIGYVHSWTRTQDEGWWRAALDTYGVPYTYFADQKLREGNLRAKYDVILFPHVGGNAVSQVNGIARTGSAPLPYKKTDRRRRIWVPSIRATTFAAAWASRGSPSWRSSSRKGGTLITEGSTATIFPEYGMTTDVSRRAAGAAVRARVDPARHESPIRRARSCTATREASCPVYFNQSPVLNAGGSRRWSAGAARRMPA